MSELVTILSVDEEGNYTCTPEDQVVTKQGTVLTYELDKASGAIWEVTGLTSSDTMNQLGEPTVGPDAVSVSALDSNTHAESFNVTVQLAHRQSGRVHGVDPQVRNEPPL